MVDRGHPGSTPGIRPRMGTYLAVGITDAAAAADRRTQQSVLFSSMNNDNNFSYRIFFLGQSSGPGASATLASSGVATHASRPEVDNYVELTSPPAEPVPLLARFLVPDGRSDVGPTGAPVAGEARWHISIATIRLRIASRPCDAGDKATHEKNVMTLGSNVSIRRGWCHSDCVGRSVRRV